MSQCVQKKEGSDLNQNLAQTHSSRSYNSQIRCQGIEEGNEVKVNYEHLRSEKQKFYDVVSSKVLGSNITKQNRAKLKTWLAEQLTKNMYCRQTYATTSKYLDMYLNKKFQIRIESFQVLGLACFTLASKVVESRLPAISYEVFEKDEILKFEKKILFSFQFKVLPLTYVGMAQILLTQWKSYSLENQIPYQVDYFEERFQSVQRFRSFLEILDCMDLVPQSLDFDTSSLIFLTFFYEHRINCLGCPHPETISEAIQIWELLDEYKQIFNDFSEYLNDKCELFENCHCDAVLLNFVFPFLNLKTRQNENIQVKLSPYKPSYTLMSFNEGCYQLARKVMSRKKGN